MAIPLLPPELILAAFDRLLAIEFVDLPVRDQQNIFAFKKYVQKTWIDQFTPEILSVFGMENATNNGSESFHKLLKSDIKSHRPNAWSFVIKLSEILKDKSIVYQQLLQHGESEVFRQRRTKVLTNLHTRRQAEAELTASTMNE